MKGAIIAAGALVAFAVFASAPRYATISTPQGYIVQTNIRTGAARTCTIGDAMGSPVLWPECPDWKRKR